MKALIAVVNARHRQPWRDVVRCSWVNQVPKDKADVFFFMGRGEPRTFAADEIELDCSDRYEHLPEKVRAMSRWALARDYHHMLKCDDDVVLRPNDILNSGYEAFDFSGKGNRPPQPYVVSFGFNYWMSRKSMQLIADAELPPDGSNDDEKWVAKTLWDHNIALHSVDRYKLHMTFDNGPENPRRALRAPRQLMEIKDPHVFSRCIHFEGPTIDESTKLKEFVKVFQRYGEK
jgi:hypothetical protein